MMEYLSDDAEALFNYLRKLPARKLIVTIGTYDRDTLEELEDNNLLALDESTFLKDMGKVRIVMNKHLINCEDINSFLYVYYLKLYNIEA